MSRDIPNTLEVTTYMACAKCIKERPPGQSMKEFARFNVGFTPLGIQVWCVRHDCNVVHVDFEGQRHPANTGAPA